MRAAPTSMAYCRKAGGRTQRLPHEHGFLTVEGWGTRRLYPERSLLPSHDRDRGEAIERRPLDHTRAIRQIHQRPVRQIDHTYDLGLLEEERRLHAKHLSLFGKLREIDGDRADLPTRERKAGPILCHAYRPFHPAGARVREMARHPRHLGIIEGADTNFVVCT